MAEGGGGVDTNTGDQRASALKRGGFSAAVGFGWLAVILPGAVPGFGVQVQVPPLTAGDESIASAWCVSWYCLSGLGGDECGCVSQRVLPLWAFAYL